MHLTGRLAKRTAALAVALAVTVVGAAGTANGAVAPGTVLPGTLTPASAEALPLGPEDQRVHDLLAERALDPKLGADTTGVVTDLATGRVLWSQHRLTRQLPASTTKLVTAVNALQTFGPEHRFTTRVRRGATWSRLVLVGAGDPSLTTGNLAALARDSAAAVTAAGRTRVAVYVDDSLFPAPTRAYGWKKTYVPADVSPVRALVVNQRRRLDTSLDAGNAFAKALAAQGVTVSRVVRGRAPKGAPVLAAVQGQRLDAIVTTMLQRSDNDHAEALHRLVARRAGYPATWAGAAAAQRAVLAGLGVDLATSRLYDGSGLSRAGRLTAAQLVAVLALAYDGTRPRLAPLTQGMLPVAGQSGTLGANYLRYNTAPTSCAAGLIEAKTGSLSGVISLAGTARGADGQLKLFAFLVNGMPSTLTTRRAVDRLASTVTGCW
jgi:D-alanyl-D-alanine carboxypeptidase/D-alanyl-D-alanine-endopeptidase (penicillin-binding protein 4)